MSDLTDFLLARVSADEETARRVAEAVATMPRRTKHQWAWSHSYKQPGAPGWSSFLWDGAPSPARVLAECQAKRAIIALCWSPDPHTVWEAEQGQCNECGVLYALAQVHRDHPDFRPEWRIA